MLKYVCKRIVAAFLTLFVLVTVVFFLVRLMPGEPFTSAKLTAEVAENMEKYYGFDKPLPVQYVQYIGNLLHGNFGYSMKYTNKTVNYIIGQTFPFSADLGIRALVMAVSFGLILGILSARNRGNKIDFLCVLIAILGTSIPDFIMGAFLQYFFGIKWGLLPVAQYNGFKYTILPACALSFYTLASVSRIMRASMLEVVQQDYIKTAKAKGLSDLRIVCKHQIRNAIMPVITVMGPTVASVLTGTFVVESIFAVPGMGKYYVESINNNDYSMILGMTVFYGAFLVVCNLIVDILYGIPSLIVTILVMTVTGRGIVPLIIAMCIVGWIGTCRFVRGEVYRLKGQDFVSAAKVLGVPDFVIIVRHILPNIIGLMVTNLCMAIPWAIFQEAFLSYIGMGITPPNCSWGVLAKEGVGLLRVAPHNLLEPAFFICTTMLALNMLGDGLRDAVDPKLRGTE